VACSQIRVADALGLKLSVLRSNHLDEDLADNERREAVAEECLLEMLQILAVVK
jgi:hypothetical protein